MYLKQIYLQLVNEYGIDENNAIAMAKEIVSLEVSVEEYLTDKGMI